jgi:hypothetical protein
MTDFAPYMLQVATELWGPPRPGATKTEVRFGDQRTINPLKGNWWDHGEQKGGGVLDLITRETGRKGRDAIAWLRDRGFHVDDEAPARAPRAPAGPKPRAQAPKAPPAHTPAQAPAPRAQMVKAWDYLDETGALLFQVCRMEDGSVDARTGKPKKTFVQRRKPLPSDPPGDVKGGWVWKRDDVVRVVPYRLPEIGDALAQDLLVFIVEGEKAADRLAALGVPATCNPGGAGKWPQELTEHFGGAHIVILPDNDPQVLTPKGEPKFREDGSPVFPGQDHAELVARELLPVAASVRILDLPGLPDKGDVDDWIEAGGTADALYDLVDRAAVEADRWIEDRPWRARTIVPPFVSRFAALPWAHLDDPGPEHEWLVRGFLTAAELSMVAGASKAGKSFLVLDMAMAIARGVPWFGNRTLQGGVIYQAGEGARGFKKRMRAYRVKNGLSLQDPIPFVLLPRPVDLFGSDDPTNQLIEEARHWAGEMPDPLRLLVIDTWSAATPGAKENASEDVSRVLARLERVREALGCAVMLVHHLNADGTKVRGHTSMMANLENVIVVTVDENRIEPEAVRRLEDGREHRRVIRRAKVEKNKDGEGDATLEFVLEQVPLGENAYGDRVTSCVIAEPRGAQQQGGGEDAGTGGRTPGPKTDHEWQLVRAISEALASHGEFPPQGAKIPGSALRTVVHFKHVRDRYRALTLDVEGDPQKLAERVRKQLERAGKGLIAAGVIGREEPYVWFARPVGTTTTLPAPAQAAFDDDPLGGWTAPAGGTDGAPF